ncbi:hypothetical protein AURDEDRAFT_114681 [Auricularia subglabra TFB-10046 SS5]|nr:hypothetical protein AURDEDRAFT_114681 [Auricularia subglabra TFB-10046 SS5]
MTHESYDRAAENLLSLPSGASVASPTFPGSQLGSSVRRAVLALQEILNGPLKSLYDSEALYYGVLAL